MADKTGTPEIWVTLEETPRRLIVRGRSAIDSDCLVAHLDGDEDRPLWIVLNASATDRCFVTGIEVYASKVRR